jgi:hypothetical protein
MNLGWFNGFSNENAHHLVWLLPAVSTRTTHNPERKQHHHHHPNGGKNAARNASGKNAGEKNAGGKNGANGAVNGALTPRTAPIKELIYFFVIPDRKYV